VRGLERLEAYQIIYLPLFRHLQANTKDDRKVVIAENLVSVTFIKEALMEVLYQKFKVSPF
jgi:hypothetical protein